MCFISNLIGVIQLSIFFLRRGNMKFLQKLGKALMLPVAVLPICVVS